MPDNELTVTIGGDVSKLQVALSQVEHHTEDLNDRLAKLAFAAGEIFAAFELLSKPLEAYGAQEKVINELNQALKTQGIYSHELSEKYVEQSEALEKKTGIDAAAIIQGQAHLQSLIGQKQITEELTKAVVDFAAHNKMDVASAFDLVGRSVYGSTMMLKRHGIEVNESLSSNERLAKFIQEVSTKFDGQAEAAVKGLGGLKLLSTAFEDLEKAIGARLAPTISSMARTLSDLFHTIAQNDTLVTIIEVALEAVAVFTAFSGALKLASIATTTMKVAVEGLWGATGIGALIVVVVELATHWKTVWPVMQDTFHAFVNNIGSVASALGTLLQGVFTLDTSKIKQSMSDLADAFKKGWAESTASIKKASQDIKETEDEMTDAQKKAAAQAQKARDDQEARRIASVKAAQAAVLAEANNESKAMIALKKQEAEILAKMADEKNAAILTQLKNHLAQVQKMEVAQIAIDEKRHASFQQKILKDNSVYQRMTADQQSAFLRDHGAQLEASLDTEATAQQTAAVNEANLQIQSNNKYLQDQVEFGTAYAAINQAMHSAVYEGSKQSFGQMAELSQSSNATLKAIGKAATVANIAFKTAEGAIAAYAGFVTALGPIFGTPLGIAAASAMVAYGAEQEAKAVAANTGGMIPGIGPDKDSVLLFGTPGEFVTPQKNYDETVNAVADARIAAKNSSAPASSSGLLSDILSDIRDQLQAMNSKFEAPIVVNGDVMTDKSFIDLIARQLSDAVRYRNARLT